MIFMGVMFGSSVSAVWCPPMEGIPICNKYEATCWDNQLSVCVSAYGTDKFGTNCGTVLIWDPVEVCENRCEIRVMGEENKQWARCVSFDEDRSENFKAWFIFGSSILITFLILVFLIEKIKGRFKKKKKSK